jgi:hypothetical protein
MAAMSGFATTLAAAPGASLFSGERVDIDRFNWRTKNK